MTSFRDKLPDWLAHLSPRRIVVIVVFSIWCGAAGLLVDPLVAVLYAIGFLDIVGARGKSRKWRVAGAVGAAVVSLFLVLYAAALFESWEVVAVLGLPVSLFWLGWENLRSA